MTCFIRPAGKQISGGLAAAQYLLIIRCAEFAGYSGNAQHSIVHVGHRSRHAQLETQLPITATMSDHMAAALQAVTCEHLESSHWSYGHSPPK